MFLYLFEYLEKTTTFAKQLQMSSKFRQQDGYVFKIYSNEEERKHIHVIKAECEAKFWLEPELEIADNYGFKSREIKEITQILEIYGEQFKQQFTEYIGKRIDD